jgi:hypothetical protein
MKEEADTITRSYPITCILEDCLVEWRMGEECSVNFFEEGGMR